MTARPAPAFPHGCFCGCGETANAGRHYRPGHDARHAKNVFVGWLDGYGIGDSLDRYWHAIRQLPTQALQRKLRDRMRRFTERPEVITQVWELEAELRREPNWLNVRGLLTETDSEWTEGHSFPGDRFIVTTAIAMGWTRRAVLRRRS